MTWIKKKTDGTYNEFNFVVPNEDLGDQSVLFPCTEAQTPDYAAEIEVEVKAFETFVAPAALEGNLEIALAVDAAVTAGAKLHIKITPDDQGRTVTFSTGFAEEIEVATGDQDEYFSFVYNGSVFLPIGLPVSRHTIDDIISRVTALET
jgi:hypothetical protein